MEHLTAWAGFFGVWLLVAGPLYQANLELRAEDIAVDRIRATAKQVHAPDQVSNWWWLVPPIHWVLRRRRQEAYKRLILDVMQDEDYEALTQFVNKAVGWILVAVGALLIAAKETYGLCQDMEWSDVVFWILLVVMGTVCNGYTAGRISRTERRLAEHAGRVTA
jgi:hypothetical protein